MKKEKASLFDRALFGKIMAFSKPYKRYYYLVMAAAILLSAFSTLTPYLLKIAVDDYITPRLYEGLLLFICIMLGTLLLEVFFQYIFVYYANWLGQMIVKDLRTTLFKKLIHFKMAYFDTSAVGRLVTRSVNDIETIASIFSQGLFMIIADFLKMGLVIVIMLSINWELSLIVFSVLPIIVYATRVFQRSMKKAFEDVRKEIANLNTFVQERISGMKIVQLFGREAIEQNTFEAINARHKNAWLKTVWFNSIFFPVAEISTSVTIGLLVWYGGFRSLSGVTISLGTLFLFIQLAQMLFRPLRQLADKFNTLQMGMVAAERVFAILATESAIENTGKHTPKLVNGQISLENLHFSYLPNEEVLKGISLVVEPGETVAIVGATGAGKSTLINLISRFYEFDKGDIKIDGISIRDYELSNLRRQVALVMQDVFLFADSIMNNITLFDPNISRKDVIDAAKKIGVHSFIESLPNGYDYNVQERGVMLSSGQRQLIAFLRAYLSSPSILVLDEATSSVDSFSEELIQQATEQITKGKTSIIIAHRLATIKKANRIVVMDQGRIIEVGSHKELIEKEGGAYQKLHQLQFNQEEVV
ncbi:ABC transporter ATP-binding protein/permease [Flavobacteriaceae bacterium]|nr:ABC transporter ATP-binding protein/permease [Flavobacteriaceae bacterium]MDB4112567.1 ABC transporter ATP-binding protein/permease [Flavobacteriaceae bacterium]MDB4187431.1 ABC transporter ATP-binding protein/permease [Flavobacteriaceae bacterium]MDB9824215.1 ABC transporter ATP-binding protein/permease [Flavobacteriaceae bacterium]